MPAYYQGPKTAHFTGSRFYNPWNPFRHSWMRVLKWKCGAKPKLWPKSLENRFFDTPPAQVLGSELRISFVGHATLLIQTQGINIVTDPVWTEALTNLSYFSIKRVAKPGIAFENLPKIDLVLISHNHYDHLNLETLSRICQKDNCRVIAPLGNDAIIHAYDPSIHVQTLDWQQSYRVSESIEIHLLPAQHWSARGVFDINKALWGAFVIATGGGNIYFAGDTGFEPALFSQAKETFGRFRLAMLPSGSDEPRWFMQYVHLNPEDAVRAYEFLGASYGVPMHFATFRLADESYEDPLEAFIQAREKHGVDESRFRSLQIGQSWLVPAAI